MRIVKKIAMLGPRCQPTVVRNSQLCVGTELDATLSLDHRVIDGAMAAEYLTTVRHNLENPATLLVWVVQRRLASSSRAIESLRFEQRA